MYYKNLNQKENLRDIFVQLRFKVNKRYKLGNH